MTWKGTDHIHCCTQIINPGEEKKKKKKKKEKQLSHRLGSHARTRAQRNRGAHGARRTRRPPPRKKKKKDQNKQDAEERGCWRSPAWMQMPGVAWMRPPRRAAPRPQAVNTAAGVHVLILLCAVRAEQRQTMCCGEQAGSPVQTNAGCISSSHRRCVGGGGGGVFLLD